MATIEERAEAYADKQVNIGTQALCRIEGYIVGATEQKKIDIDKASKWLEAYHEGYVGEKEALVQMFRKAMEE